MRREQTGVLREGNELLAELVIHLLGQPVALKRYDFVPHEGFNPALQGRLLVRQIDADQTALSSRRSIE